MLVQFSFTNYLSFKDQATLDMSAIDFYKEHPSNLFFQGKNQILKVAAIYGANASGKSNIFAAFSTFQKIVIESFNSVPEGEKIPIHRYFLPFQFDEERNNTEFEVIFIHKNTEYQYGFEYNSQQIVAEWLYKRSDANGDTAMLFEREETIKFGDEISPECSLYQGQIPKETLALTFLSRLILKNNLLRTIYEALAGMIVVTNKYYQNISFLEKLLPDIIDRDKGDLLAFLSAVDTGIQDIEYHKKEHNLYICTTHLDAQGKAYKLPILNESEGTIKGILVYLQVKNAIQHDKTIFIDELNAQLHPLLHKFIIDLFYNHKSKAQLIYTTHDTTLLDQRYFRRDQIWFVQKDEQGHSTLGSLAEFKIPKSGTFGLNYLAGVYGGIPNIKDFNIKAGD